MHMVRLADPNGRGLTAGTLGAIDFGMGDDIKAYRLKYVGARFSGARMPVEVLADLPAFRDLIAAIAKDQFRRQNSYRQRVPRGFDQSIAFTLLGITDGSAVPLLALDKEVAQRSLPNVEDEVETVIEAAYHEAAQLIDDASRGKFRPALPTDVIQAIKKFGANIRDGERIELLETMGDDGNVVAFDLERRKRLLTHARETYTAELQDVAILTGVDVTRNQIQVESVKFGELKLDLSQIGADAKRFDGATQSQVEFTARVALDAHDTFRQIEELHSADLVRPYDEVIMKCIERVQNLAALEPGWLGNGCGERIVHLAGTRATQLIFTRAKLANLFRIYPTEEGGLSIEFDKDGGSFAVEILPDGSIEMDGSSNNGDAIDAQTFEKLDAIFYRAFDEMTNATNV